MLGALLAMAFNTQAQVAAKVDKTYGVTKPPTWAPKAPTTVKYYYLPDIQTYYDVPAKRYIYQKDGVWTRTSVLPTRYNGYDLRKGQTVYLTDYNGTKPYAYYKKHKVKYAGKPWKPNGRDNGNHYGQLKNGNNGNKGKANANGNGHGNGNGNGKAKAKGHGKK